MVQKTETRQERGARFAHDSMACYDTRPCGAHMSSLGGALDPAPHVERCPRLPPHGCRGATRRAVLREVDSAPRGETL